MEFLILIIVSSIALIMLTIFVKMARYLLLVIGIVSTIFYFTASTSMQSKIDDYANKILTTVVDANYVDQAKDVANNSVSGLKSNLNKLQTEGIK